MDDGSRGRRMVRKELDVTSTHELLSHTLLAGCDRSSIAQTLGIWKSQLHQCETDFEYGNPTSLAATPSLAMQHTPPAGSPSTSPHTAARWKTNSGVDFASILTSHSFAMQQALAAGTWPPPGTQTCFDING